MLDPKNLDEMAQRFKEALPEGVRQFGDDLEQVFRSVLQSAFAKLDLVTREEFDAQVKVLERTRNKLEDLEIEVGAMHKKASSKSDKKD